MSSTNQDNVAIVSFEEFSYRVVPKTVDSYIVQVQFAGFTYSKTKRSLIFEQKDELVVFHVS